MGLVTLIFDRLTLKLLRWSHLRWGKILPNLGTLGLWVLELFAMYATDGQKQCLFPPSLRGRGITTAIVLWLRFLLPEMSHDSCLRPVR